MQNMTITKAMLAGLLAGFGLVWGFILGVVLFYVLANASDDLRLGWRKTSEGGETQ